MINLQLNSEGDGDEGGEEQEEEDFEDAFTAQNYVDAKTEGDNMAEGERLRLEIDDEEELAEVPMQGDDGYGLEGAAAARTDQRERALDVVQLGG